MAITPDGARSALLTRSGKLFRFSTADSPKTEDALAYRTIGAQRTPGLAISDDGATTCVAADKQWKRVFFAAKDAHEQARARHGVAAGDGAPL